MNPMFAHTPLSNNVDTTSIPKLHDYATYLYNSSTLTTRLAKPSIPNYKITSHDTKVNHWTNIMIYMILHRPKSNAQIRNTT